VYGRFIVSGSHDNTLKVWDAVTGIELRTYSGHTNGLNSAAFSPDGQLIASGDRDGTLKLWRAPSALSQPAITLSPTQGLAPLTVTLDATGSTDPDGTITGYRWEVDGQTLAGIKHAVTFNQPGSYPVKLMVTDNFGLTAEVQQSVQVKENSKCFTQN
jgi:WD40 repeat protein